VDTKCIFKVRPNRPCLGSARPRIPGFQSLEDKVVRVPRARCSLRSLLALVALAGMLLGAERLWRRAEFYRKQSALCAIFELQFQGYAADAAAWEDMTIDERGETVRENLREARVSGHLKRVYGRIARRPWEPLPPDTPSSVNPWDLGSLSASEIEEMVDALRRAPDAP
jgi:hypothetical protein